MRMSKYGEHVSKQTDDRSIYMGDRLFGKLIIAENINPWSAQQWRPYHFNILYPELSFPLRSRLQEETRPLVNKCHLIVRLFVRLVVGWNVVSLDFIQAN